MIIKRENVVIVLLAFFAIFAFAACAGTAGSTRAVATLGKEADLTKFSQVVVEVQCEDGVPLTAADKDRITTSIIAGIRQELPNRFREINPTAPDASTLHAYIKITRYDKGNAFARFMLAGLGQIHIDADVLLNNWETKENLVKYEVNKTFAWGGLYGVATRIEDVEEGFAKAVVAFLGEEKR